MELKKVSEANGGRRKEMSRDVRNVQLGQNLRKPSLHVPLTLRDGDRECGLQPPGIGYRSKAHSHTLTHAHTRTHKHTHSHAHTQILAHILSVGKST